MTSVVACPFFHFLVTTVERGYKVSIRHLAHSKYTSNIYYNTYKTVLLYGGSDKVKITPRPRLLTAKVKASQTDQKRIESEYEEKKKPGAMLRQDQEAEYSRKRADEAAEKAKLEEKKRKLDADEKRLTEELKYDEVMLDGMTERAKNSLKSSDLAEAKSAIESADQMRKKIEKKREELSNVTSNIKKLLLKSKR